MLWLRPGAGQTLEIYHRRVRMSQSHPYHPPVPRLLALIPHPDDESYSFGGTLALAAKHGWECRVVCASSGEKGKRHDGGATGREAVGAAREAELARSCEVLGLPPPEFWRLPDGALRAAEDGQARAAQAMATFDPDLVLTLGADGAYGHPDHTALHRWVVGAWSALGHLRPALLFPAFELGLFLPQYEKCIAMMGDPPQPPAAAIGGRPWHYEIPLAAARETKLAAIKAHRSQLPAGNPEALFPPGIVAALLEIERFEDARGRRDPRTAALLAGLR